MKRVLACLGILPSLLISPYGQSKDLAELQQMTIVALNEPTALHSAEQQIADAQEIAREEALRQDLLNDAFLYSQRLAKAALMAIHGDAHGFLQLHESRDRLDMTMKALRDHPRYQDGASIEALMREWKEIHENATALIDRKAAINDLHAAVDEINGLSHALSDWTEQAVFHRRTNDLSGITPLTEMLSMSYRMTLTANRVLVSDSVDYQLAFLMGYDPKEFALLVDENLNGSTRLPGAAEGKAKENAIELKETFDMYKRPFNKIRSMLEEINEAKLAARSIVLKSENLLSRLHNAKHNVRQL